MDPASLFSHGPTVNIYSFEKRQHHLSQGLTEIWGWVMQMCAGRGDGVPETEAGHHSPPSPPTQAPSPSNSKFQDSEEFHFSPYQEWVSGQSLTHSPNNWREIWFSPRVKIQPEHAMVAHGFTKKEKWKNEEQRAGGKGRGERKKVEEEYPHGTDTVYQTHNMNPWISELTWMHTLDTGQMLPGYRKRQTKQD